MDAQVFAKRLKQARILKKISMDQLVQMMGGCVTKQAISKYEAAKMVPGSTVHIALATALGVDLDYFFRPFNFDINDLEVSFRKKSNTTVKDVNALKVQIQDQVERYLEVEEILGINEGMTDKPEGDVLSTSEQMREEAIKLRKKWNLGFDAISNVLSLLEFYNIKVIMSKAPKGFDGVSGVVNNSNYIIVLNEDQDHVERRRFTAMHELGHLLYNDRFAENLTQREREKLCDSFASEMLFPSSILKEIFKPGDNITTFELKQMQMVYGISIDALMHELHEIGIVSDSKYRGFCIQKNKNKSFKDWVEGSRYEEYKTSRFETMVYTAMGNKLITISKAASLLQQSVSNVRKHLNVI